MLILQRKLGETIKIGKNIEISVVELSKNQVKLGITAPEDMAIIRDDAVCKDSPEKKTSSAIMEEVAGLLLEIAAGSYSRQKTRQAMKRVERLMRKYADLKVAEKKSSGCCGKCDGNCSGGCNHG
ncbi:MAG: Carbon storage regulator [Planctomycetes bacterium ADurb.Bin401]|nr:MAG: Carbon storage regulator [Planctomycetes bacterium ADurb.Bin401]